MKFGIIGHPVRHSLSPRMHAANFRAIGFDGSFEARDVEPCDLSIAIDQFKTEGFRGINVTIPHKEAMAKLVDRLEGMAAQIGAINTVRFEPDGTTTGFNTDALGFSKPLEEIGFQFKGAKVLLLGAGGAARAVAFECARLGCAALTIANRTFERAAELAVAVDGTNGIKATAARLEACAAESAEYNLIVNSTSIGLKEADPPILPETAFRKGQIFYDIIPVNRETSSMKAAKAAGAGVLGGLGFLAAQGAAAFEIWTGLAADIKSMEKEIWKS